ncbi:hypothetical protein TWF694_006241 [Orbilia ellipsospora]|uniref:Zn(2)-C6 fungal-type domain-containing protein n=1 Tax=Orbilia ellipsospora TaxID=2528407 RepID=A0AAV9XK02_9PEZI
MSTEREQRASKTQRVLACVLCQQRKVKCDRKFPCANCVRAQAPCVPATLTPRQRRRRFPEKELIDRLQHYEGLLRENNINFEPLHSSSGPAAPPPADNRSPSEDGGTSTDTPSSEPQGKKPRPRHMWHAMYQTMLASDDEGEDEEDKSNDVRDAVVKHIWDRTYDQYTNDNLLFGSPASAIDLHTLHPPQVQIFRLWQIYLDNVNPLLKITHTPTLQPRIIDAAAEVEKIPPNLEALLFSIYCMAVLSLGDEECEKLLGTPKAQTLSSYQFACRQALQNCDFLRSSDRECLIALFLYLVSIRPDTDPRSLSSMLAVAVRSAHRMGIHDEATNAKCIPLEAEMRRRLWWALVIFDNRVCEMFDYKTVSLSPTWSCKIPINANDSELRPEMKNPPVVLNEHVPTESLFVVVRSELADFIRHSAFHLDFTNPSLKTIRIKKENSNEPASIRQESHEELLALEMMVNAKHLGLCNPENGFHFMTMLSTRVSIAKGFLMEYYLNYIAPSDQDPKRDTFSHALTMLDCDTRLMTSPLTKGFNWYILFHFPFPAWVHVLQDLRHDPNKTGVENAWDVMSDNYDVRVKKAKRGDRPLFVVFARMVLHTWTSREETLRSQGLSSEQILIPRMVTDIREQLAQMRLDFFEHGCRSYSERPPGNGFSTNIDEMFIPSQDFAVPQSSVNQTPMWGHHDVSNQAAMDIDVNQVDWTTIDWNAIRGW